MAALPNSLMVLNDIQRRLATITTVDEAKKIRDQAEAIRVYAKKVKAGLAVQNRAAAIKILAEGRAGELLANGSLRHQGGRPRKRCSTELDWLRGCTAWMSVAASGPSR